jgi:hypothetical protein
MKPEEWDPNAPVVVPDVDWNQVPVLANLSTEHFDAYIRCYHHKELKKLRQIGHKLLAADLDGALRPLGFENHKDHWIKGPFRPGVADKPSRVEVGQAPPRQSWFKTLFAKPAVQQAMSYLKTDGSVFLALQKQNRGFCSYINVGVRHPPRVGSGFASYLVDGFYVNRLNAFLSDLHPIHQLDQLFYVRLAEDERFRRAIIDIILLRIVPWLDAFNKPILLVSGPNPADMAAHHPLPFAPEIHAP